jgi:hypothetical protein
MPAIGSVTKAIPMSIRLFEMPRRMAKLIAAKATTSISQRTLILGCGSLITHLLTRVTQTSVSYPWTQRESHPLKNRDRCTPPCYSRSIRIGCLERCRAWGSREFKPSPFILRILHGHHHRRSAG